MGSTSSNDDFCPDEASHRPRRATTSKLFHKKKVWLGEGLIRKTVIRGEDVIRWVKTKDEFPGGEDKMDGLNVGVSYALKKKNRHHFTESVENGQLNLEAADFPDSLETISMNKVYSNYRGKVEPYSFEGLAKHNVYKEVTVLSRDGEMATLKGVFSSDTPGLQPGKHSLHYQYDYNEYEYIPKIHRPSYKCSCYSCTCARSREALEGHKLGKDVARTGYLAGDEYWEEETKESGAEQEVKEIPDYKSPSATFNLGDVPVKKSKRRAKRQVEGDWVLL